jgi:hypothetical protein
VEISSKIKADENFKNTKNKENKDNITPNDLDDRSSKYFLLLIELNLKIIINHNLMS